ncbi:uncharacterized protein K02A2.6-like [Ceratina calcarata]|uniref:Uncharacterized protein K02A2.6-like n=1 Tax=Ceratina calcarata TaxID=156304 RepID=A0AAJ7JEN5_9HYME|nr:uncharacterized protein K02A2.6-like [Ceratina calcarata]
MAQPNRPLQENKKLMAAQALLSAGRPERVATTIVKGTIGSISEYSLDDDWTSWCERLDMYILANEVREDKKVSLFLTLLGKDGYALLRNLTTPNLPSQTSFAELKQTMRQHLQPAPNPMAERYKFKECTQKEGEDIKRFLVNLKRLSTFCEFGDNLENSLRDQFVWRLSSDIIKKKLLGEKDLSYQRAVELALSLELAGKNAAEMKSPGSSATVNYVASKGRTSSTNTKKEDSNVRYCYCCGRTNHITVNCKYKQYGRNLCGKKGHLRNVCKNKTDSAKAVKSGKKDNGKKSNKHRDSKREQQNFVAEVDRITECLDNMFHLSREGSNTFTIAGDKPIVVELLVEGCPVKFEVDTGSPISAISTVYRNSSELFSALPLRRTHRRFKSYQGDVIVPEGILGLTVSHKGKTRWLELFVIPGSSAPIIGRRWLSELEILQVGSLKLNNIQKLTQSPTVEAIIKEFGEVFSDRLGTYNKAKITLRAKPIFRKPRPVPYALRTKIEKELNRLVEARILEQVTTSDWATPIVPVPKANGELRICGDFKDTINKDLDCNRHPIPRIIDLATQMSRAAKFTKLDLASAYQQVELDEASKQLVVLSIPKGLYKCNRLMYGVSPAPGLFQAEMEKILSGINTFTTACLRSETSPVAGNILEEKTLRKFMKQLTLLL